jgi:hypothetical protein
MMINRQSIGLKGQLILAQGKRSVALGWRMGIKNVRATTFIKEKILFRTSEMTLCFPEMMPDNSVRRDFFALFIESARTVFFYILYPGRRFGSFLPKLCPGLKSTGPSGRKNMHALACV